MSAATPRSELGWRRELSRKLGCLLAAKALALAALWAMFFSPQHRLTPDESLLDQRLSIATPASPEAPLEEGRRRD